ncbi:hypothetical protein GGR53DRAFT_519953 [Hypoxylon sp. FL1150]|nr:hypothetical protein GGR53DRAFT_519953 [Hypoxylon sp. FL1150]
MELTPLLSVSVVQLGGSRACLHDNILAHRIEDELAALRRRDVPVSVDTAIQNGRFFDDYYITDSDENVKQTIDTDNPCCLPLGPSRENAKFNPDPNYLADYIFGNGSNYFQNVKANSGGPAQEQQNELVNCAHTMGHFVVTHAPGVLAYTQEVTARTDVLSSIFFRDNNSANSTYEKGAQNVSRQHLASVPITVGTDAVGNAVPQFYCPFVHQGLINLVDAGMTPVEALRAATVVPAAVHGLNDGSAFKPRMRADLTLLNSNPVEYANITK